MAQSRLDRTMDGMGGPMMRPAESTASRVSSTEAMRTAIAAWMVSLAASPIGIAMLSSPRAIQCRLPPKLSFPAPVTVPLKMLPGGITTRPSRATGAITTARMVAEPR